MITFLGRITMQKGSEFLLEGDTGAQYAPMSFIAWRASGYDNQAVPIKWLGRRHCDLYFMSMKGMEGVLKALQAGDINACHRLSELRPIFSLRAAMQMAV